MGCALAWLRLVQPRRFSYLPALPRMIGGLENKTARS